MLLWTTIMILSKPLMFDVYGISCLYYLSRQVQRTREGNHKATIIAKTDAF